MEILRNLDLLSVGIAIAGILILGFTAYFNNRESVTNRTLFYFCLVTSFWSIVNYFSYTILIPDVSLLFTRIVIFTAVWHSFLFYTFSLVFPDDKINFSKNYKLVIIPLTFVTSILTLTPLVFEKIIEISEKGKILKIENGPGIAIFAGLVLFFVIKAITNLWVKTRKSKGETKEQLKDVLIGILLTFSLLSVFNFILPAFFNKIDFIPLGAFFMLPFVVSSFYAIYRHKLFNIKIISISLIGLLLSSLVLVEVVFTPNNEITLFKVVQFIATLFVSIYLIKTVLYQVKQKEEIEQLATNLDRANEELGDLNQNLEKKVAEQTVEIRKSYEVEKKARIELEKLNQEKDRFLLATQHELRTPLTVIKGFIEIALQEEKNEGIRDYLDRAEEASENMGKVLNNILEVTGKRVKQENDN